jgi:TM2 domain-containing membrane protein YozV
MLIGTSKASNSQSDAVLNTFKQLVINESELATQEVKLPSAKKIKLIALLQSATVENKKVTAAILTLTLGMLGVHRIYLGTAPYIPAVYLFTFGGGFFVLPIIDLVMILTTNDIAKFENNNKILMWTGE